MKKKILIVLLLLVIIALALVFAININNNRDLPLIEKINLSGDINIVTSLEDKIEGDSAWCGTFNLIWNDLKNDLAKQDIIFENQTEIINNLNKGTFTTAHLSDESYYKKYGTPSLKLKEEIEKAIKKKFNEKSDILDDFDWENRSEKDYFLYCMLKKEFEFPKVFNKLENSSFEANVKGAFATYENVKYFGIKPSTKKEVRNQVKVLYYNSEEDFAVKLITKQNDEVILTVGNNGESFLEIYNTIIDKKKNYKGGNGFREGDTLKVPYITFNLKEEITEVENQKFYFSNGEPYSIEQALQTIQFELDEKGGRIKSEAGMMVKNESAMIPTDPRHFNVDNTFTIFLIEKEKELPYFAAKISDISKVQTDVYAKVTVNLSGDESENDNISNETVNKEEKYFYGKVVESHPSYLIVEPNEDEEIRKSADRIYISLGKNGDAIYMLNTKLKITYTGGVMESYPAQVNMVDIEVIL
ncbi:MAG: hypothetical protein J6C46_11060 [Clostridia bacterium]|nr:hypothetical protein [Clostridia bacterium]